MGSDWARPQTPELTSFENPEKYSLPASKERQRPPSRFVEEFDANQALKATAAQLSSDRQTPSLTPPPSPPSKPNQIAAPYSPLLPQAISIPDVSLAEVPRILITAPSPLLHTTSPLVPPVSSRQLLLSPSLSRHFSTPSRNRQFHPSRPAPLPPSRRSSWRNSTISALEKVVASVEVSGDEDPKREFRSGLRISRPLPGSFEHVDGAFLTGDKDEAVHAF